MGYYRAGFDVTGVDRAPMPRYPFEFIQGDALEYLAAHGHEYDAIHASPPCQGYSAMRNLPWLKDRDYPMLIDPTRDGLMAVGKPWVIENVERAPLQNGITLCGTMFGLKTYRHRRFESSIMLLAPPHEKHQVVIGAGRMLNDRAKPNAEGWVSLPGKAPGKRMNGLRDNPNGMVVVAGHFAGQDAAKAAMGIDWMSRDELAEAIPPVYTEFIGRQLIAVIGREEAA